MEETKSVWEERKKGEEELGMKEDWQDIHV